MFETMKELFQILNDARRRRGSIDFDLNEAEVIIGEAGYSRAHWGELGVTRLAQVRHETAEK